MFVAPLARLCRAHLVIAITSPPAGERGPAHPTARDGRGRWVAMAGKEKHRLDKGTKVMSAEHAREIGLNDSQIDFVATMIRRGKQVRVVGDPRMDITIKINFFEEDDLQPERGRGEEHLSIAREPSRRPTPAAAKNISARK
jgi:hypothetical protein